MSIIWISGNSKSGKTTLSKALAGKHSDKRVKILDGDVVRALTNNKDLSKEGRWTHNLNVAKEAKRLSEEGFTVIVAVIAPYKLLREEIKKICGCTFIYLPGGHDTSKEYPYEWPDNKPVTAFRIYIEQDDE